MILTFKLLVLLLKQTCFSFVGVKVWNAEQEILKCCTNTGKKKCVKKKLEVYVMCWRVAAGNKGQSFFEV